MPSTQESASETVVLEGRIDASRAPELIASLLALGERGMPVITLDLSRTLYLSSSGLRALLLAHRDQQRRGGELVLMAVPAHIKRILRMCGFDRVLICRDQECSSEGTAASERG